MKREKNGSQRGELVIQSLSMNLKNEIKLETYGEMIKKVKFLVENFSSEFLSEITKKIIEKKVSLDDLISKVRKNNVDIFLILYNTK